MNILTKKIFSLFVSMFLLTNMAQNIFATQQSQIKNKLINESVFNYAAITDYYRSDNQDSQDESVIIWIQDLHNDFAVQKNIYNILNILAKSNDISVYLEGVTDKKLDTSFLQNIPNKQIKDATIKNLFESSVLSGCEYFALLNRNANIYGIENSRIYDENLARLENINKKKQFNNYIADNIIFFTNRLKKQHILNKITALQLIKLNDIYIPETFPNLHKYQTVVQNLNAIDKKQLNVQFANLIKLSQTNSALDNFLKLNTDHGYAKTYDYINLNLSDIQKNNQELMKYLKSSKLLTEINSVNMFYEKELLINRLLANEQLNESEKEILDLDHFAVLLKDFVNTTILPKHYEELKENKKYVAELINKYLPTVIKTFALHFLNDEELAAFYNANIYRNKIFADKLTKQYGNKIIIAGGFHTGLLQELKSLNKSYIVLTPKTNTKDAFNKIFSTSFKYGTDKQVAESILSVVSRWKIFFTNTQSFIDEVNYWIKQNPQLAEKTKVSILETDGVYDIDITYNDTTVTKNFTENETDTQTKQQRVSKRQINGLVSEILNVAQQNNMFGKDVKIETNNDDFLLDLPYVVPAKVFISNGKTVISINSKFLRGLYGKNYSLIQNTVKLLYFYLSTQTTSEKFLQFITDNYDDLQQIYYIQRQAKNVKHSVFFTIASKMKNFFGRIADLINVFKTDDFVIEENFANQDEEHMAQALKQAALAKQTRSYLKTFTQPPVGAYIINSDAIEGRNFNDTSSVLHAETLTFIDFLKNYIREYEMLPEGKLTDKGMLLMQILDFTLINGQQISNRTFQNRPMILKNLGINIDYQQKRTIDTVFDETNAVLKFINYQLGNPLSSASLYCTLAPCNKCAKTMSAIGINKLVYGSSSVNKSHKSINTLLENGIKVEDGVLEEQCDSNIINYRFMNLSLFRTKIASFIQKSTRILSHFLKKTDSNARDALATKILKSELDLINLKQNLMNLQDKIDWNNLLSNKELLEELSSLLQDMGAWDEPAKRAGMIYALKTKCSLSVENGNIVFYNKNNKKLNFYIGIDKKFASSQAYIDKMKKLALVKNFADMDDNLALRNTPFSKDMETIFSILSLYAIACPIPVTGNTLSETERRLNPLGNIIKELIPTVYIENAALQYDIVDGTFVKNDNYTNNIAKSVIKQDILDDLENIFGKIKSEWYEIFISFVKDSKLSRQAEKTKYKDFISSVLHHEQNKNAINFLSSANIDLTKWGLMSRAQAEKETDRIYKIIMQKNLKEKEFLAVMKILSILELSRLYFSTDPYDITEAVSLKQDIAKIDNGISVLKDVTSEVRYAITPFRPTVIRKKMAAYYQIVVQKKYPELEVVSTGKTTISVYKKGTNKAIPIRNEILQGTSPENIIFTGDEFNMTGVDYPVYLLQQQKGMENLTIINTNANNFSGTFITLSNLSAFSDEKGASGNIKRNILLQKIILSIIEENIDAIATDEDYEPVNIVQELKSRIYNIQVDFEDISEQTQTKNILDLLKAA